MATISENLQILKDSTAAIKQAIIDKGGTINGDITTWADAINGISGGGSSSEEEYIFTGTIIYDNLTDITITGSLNKSPYTEYSSNHLLALCLYTGGISYDSCEINTVGNVGPYTLTIHFNEPLEGDEIPAICIVTKSYEKHTVTPVKFKKNDMSTNPS